MEVNHCSHPQRGSQTACHNTLCTNTPSMSKMHCGETCCELCDVCHNLPKLKKFEGSTDLVTLGHQLQALRNYLADFEKLTGGRSGYFELFCFIGMCRANLFRSEAAEVRAKISQMQKLGITAENQQELDDLVRRRRILGKTHL